MTTEKPTRDRIDALCRRSVRDAEFFAPIGVRTLAEAVLLLSAELAETRAKLEKIAKRPNGMPPRRK